MNHDSLRASPALALMLAACLAPAALAFDVGDALEDQFIIRLAPNQSIEDVAATYGAVVLARYEPRGLYLLGTDPNIPDADEDLAFDLDDRIEGDEQNSENAVAEGHTQSFFVRIAEQNIGKQPVASYVSLPNAHRISTGAGVVVAVLDTGVSPHAFLSGAVAPGGYNFVDDNTDPSDTGTGVMAGHGTFVSGLIHMVAPGATILPIRVMDSAGMGTSFMIAEGIYHAIDHGARVINISMSSPKASTIVVDAIAEAQSLGIIVVAAVDNRHSDDKVYPAADAGVIAVAATDLSDVKLGFSGFGSYVDLAAPGEDLISILPNNQFAVASGTSFAAALVSGTSALVTARFQAQGFTTINNQLLQSALDLTAANGEMAENLGYGRVRPWQALQRLRPPPKTSR
ncbi:MAG: S8 family serine peptidase [Phycisphaerae bacterium]|nr:S8 family serine peptidase [Phycisphaerae bacterium]